MYDDDRSNPDCSGRGAGNVPGCECLRIFERLVDGTLPNGVLQLRSENGRERHAHGVLYGMEPMPESAANSEANRGTSMTEKVGHGVLPVEPQPSDRCAICGWPLVKVGETVAHGCVRGNCSLRPFPNVFYDFDRACLEYKRNFDAKYRRPATVETVPVVPPSETPKGMEFWKAAAEAQAGKASSVVPQGAEQFIADNYVRHNYEVGPEDDPRNHFYVSKSRPHGAASEAEIAEAYHAAASPAAGGNAQAWALAYETEHAENAELKAKIADLEKEFDHYQKRAFEIEKDVASKLATVERERDQAREALRSAGQASVPPNPHGWRMVCICCGCPPKENVCMFNCACHDAAVPPLEDAPATPRLGTCTYRYHNVPKGHPHYYTEAFCDNWKPAEPAAQPAGTMIPVGDDDDAHVQWVEKSRDRVSATEEVAEKDSRDVQKTQSSQPAGKEAQVKKWKI